MLVFNIRTYVVYYFFFRYFSPYLLKQLLNKAIIPITTPIGGHIPTIQISNNHPNTSIKTLLSVKSDIKSFNRPYSGFT